MLKLASSKEGGGVQANKARNFGARAAFFFTVKEPKIFWHNEVKHKGVSAIA